MALSGRGQCYLYGVPTDISPTVISAVTGLALVVLMIAGHTLAKTIRNCEEQHLLPFKSWRVLGMPEGHTVRLRAQRERERDCEPGARPLLQCICGFAGLLFTG